MVNIIKKSEEHRKAQFPKLSIFAGQKSILLHYYIQNVKDRIQIRLLKRNKESVNHFSQFISVKVKKTLRASHIKHWDPSGYTKLYMCY